MMTGQITHNGRENERKGTHREAIKTVIDL
jgi:hypothetical protein